MSVDHGSGRLRWEVRASVPVDGWLGARSAAVAWLQETRELLGPMVEETAGALGLGVVAGVYRLRGLPSPREWGGDLTSASFDELVRSFGDPGRDGAWSMAVDGELGEGPLTARSEVTISDDQRWLDLGTLVGLSPHAAGLDPSGLERSLVGLIRDFSVRFEPTFANITDDNDVVGTGLELALGRDADEGHERSPRVLRGYSWVTLLPRFVAELLESRLGDLDPELVTWERLPTGAVLVQAGPSLSEYGLPRMIALFHCVAPALPPGTPMRVPTYPGMPPLRLIFEDAASVP
jgi:hypothetical protein